MRKRNAQVSDGDPEFNVRVTAEARPGSRESLHLNDKAGEALRQLPLDKLGEITPEIRPYNSISFVSGSVINGFSCSFRKA